MTQNETREAFIKAAMEKYTEPYKIEIQRLKNELADVREDLELVNKCWKIDRQDGVTLQGENTKYRQALSLYFDLRDKAESPEHFDYLLDENKWVEKSKQALNK